MMSELRQVRRAPEIDPPLTPVHGTPIDHPSAWTVADFKTPADYTIELDAAHLRDIEHAIRQIKTAGLGLDDLQREHFEVPSLRPVIDEIRRQIGDGRGFVVVRRLPVEDYSKGEIGMIFWGLGTHLGRGLSQSVLGDLLGHVKDFIREDPLARAYRNKQELSPHTDPCDLVGLACLGDAKLGGVSRLTSAITVHNVMLEEYPEALERLYRGYAFPRRREGKPGDLPYTPYRVPVYSHIEGKVSARYVRTYVRGGRSGGRPSDGRGRARSSRPVRGGYQAAGADAGIHAAARRDVLHQQLHDPARADRIRGFRGGGLAAAPFAALARSTAAAACPSAYPEQGDRGGARPSALLRLEQTDQEPQLTGPEKGQAMIANPVPWPDGARRAVAMTWESDAATPFTWNNKKPATNRAA